MSYFDEHVFIHDKEGGSNNPLIYSAIYSAISGNTYDYRDIFYRTMVKHHSLGLDVTVMRTPTNHLPTSLDEIIGAIYLGLIDVDFLERYGMRWHDTTRQPGVPRVVQAAIYCAGKHRNFFKDADVRDLHPIAYWVPWHVQYYAYKRKNKRKIMVLSAIMFYLWLVSVLLKRNYKNGEKQTGAISQKNIAYIILLDLSSKWWIRLINIKENLSAYFEQNHPLNNLDK